jgi:uncharacterized membrane protein
MKKTQLCLLVLILLACIPIVFAGDADGIVNQTFNIWADIRWGSSFLSISGVNISVIYPNSTAFYIQDQPMTIDSVGRYYYNFTAPYAGDWKMETVYYNSTQQIAGASAIVTIIDPPLSESVFDMIFASFLTVAIGLLLIIIGWYIKNAVVIIMAGTWFLGVSANTAFGLYNAGVTTDGLTSFTFFSLFGILIIFQGISLMLHDRADKENRRINGDE